MKDDPVVRELKLKRTNRAARAKDREKILPLWGGGVLSVGLALHHSLSLGVWVSFAVVFWALLFYAVHFRRMLRVFHTVNAARLIALMRNSGLNAEEAVDEFLGVLGGELSPFEMDLFDTEITRLGD